MPKEDVVIEEEEEVKLEAYPAADRVKREILDLHALMLQHLANYVLYSTERDKKHPGLYANPKALESLREYQVSVMTLYAYLKPLIMNSKKSGDYAELEKLDEFYVDLRASEDKIRREDWIHYRVLLTKFIHALGITKIEMDIRKDDDLVFM